MNFIRLTMVVDGQFAEFQVNLDATDAKTVAHALDSVAADARAAFLDDIQ